MKKLIILLILLLFFISPNISMINREYTHQDFTEISTLNDTILYYALLHYEVKYPTAVLAQAKLESANFQSSLYKRHNNFLGLYNSRKREYFKFNHWTECVLAYKSMVEYKLKEGEDYYQFLDRIGYASSSNYIDLVKEIEKQIQFNDKGLVTSKNKRVQSTL